MKIRPGGIIQIKVAQLITLYNILPLKAASAFTFFLVQSAHLARPMIDAASPDPAFATAIAISTATTQAPRRSLRGAASMLAKHVQHMS
jgi:hypothetical protein